MTEKLLPEQIAAWHDRMAAVFREYTRLATGEQRDYALDRAVWHELTAGDIRSGQYRKGSDGMTPLSPTEAAERAYALHRGTEDETAPHWKDLAPAERQRLIGFAEALMMISLYKADEDGKNTP